MTPKERVLGNSHNDTAARFCSPVHFSQNLFVFFDVRQHLGYDQFSRKFALQDRHRFIAALTTLK
jgi:hypothetical protein